MLPLLAALLAAACQLPPAHGGATDAPGLAGTPPNASANASFTNEHSTPLWLQGEPRHFCCLDFSLEELQGEPGWRLNRKPIESTLVACFMTLVIVVWSVAALIWPVPIIAGFLPNGMEQRRTTAGAPRARGPRGGSGGALQHQRATTDAELAARALGPPAGLAVRPAALLYQRARPRLLRRRLPPRRATTAHRASGAGGGRRAARPAPVRGLRLGARPPAGSRRGSHRAACLPGGRAGAAVAAGRASSLLLLLPRLSPRGWLLSDPLRPASALCKRSHAPSSPETGQVRFVLSLLFILFPGGDRREAQMRWESGVCAEVLVRKSRGKLSG